MLTAESRGTHQPSLTGSTAVQHSDSMNTGPGLHAVYSVQRWIWLWGWPRAGFHLWVAFRDQDTEAG